MSLDADGEVRVPCRGEVYQVNLEPVRGGEQAKERPCLVISEKGFNDNPLFICFVVPISTKVKPGVPWHVFFEDGQFSGNLEPGAILCDHTRSVSYEERFNGPLGWIDDDDVLAEVSRMIGKEIIRYTAETERALG